MPHSPPSDRVRGFFAIGIHNGKHPENLGSLWRSASLYGAAFVFTVGQRYQRQPSDTSKTWAHTPMFHFRDVDDLVDHLPRSCPLVGVELVPTARLLRQYDHRVRCAYLLGSEDQGLPERVLNRCHDLVQIETLNPWSMNVADAGTVVLWDRHVKGKAS